MENYLLIRRFKMEEKEITSITISIPKNQKEAWQKEANDRDMSMSAFIRRAVSAYLFALNSRKKKKMREKVKNS